MTARRPAFGTAAVLLGLSGDAKSAQTPVAALGDPKHGRGAQVRPGEAVVALGSRGARLA